MDPDVAISYFDQKQTIWITCNTITDSLHKMRTKIKLKIYRVDLYYWYFYLTEINCFGWDISYTNFGMTFTKERNKAEIFPNFTLEKMIDVGNVFENPVDVITEKLTEQYQGAYFNILTNNCRHFCFDVIKLLKPTQSQNGKSTWNSKIQF